jgi:DNA repair protein RadD
MRPCLRGYQIGCVERTRDAFRSVHRVVCVVPTGGGKTVIAGAVVDSAVEKGGRVLFLAHRKELIDQASAKLTQFGVEHGVIKAGIAPDLGQPVQVASVQTLVRRLGKLTGEPSPIERELGITPAHLAPFTLIIIDECHHVTAASYQTILAAWPHARVLGLTATPYRIDGAALGDCFEHLVVGASVPELIKDGHLVRTRTFAPPPPEELRAVHVQAGDYKTGEAAKVLDRTGPTAEIVRTWQARAAGRLTVGFGCTVEHCEHLAEAFRAAGIAAAAIDGEMDEDKRAEILRQLRAGELRVVFNVALLTEGFDLPDLACLIQARPTKSRSFWRQMCGRIMRPAPGKADGLILDHAANGHRFGIPDQADVYSLTEDVRTKRASRGEPEAATCPACHLLLPVPAPAVCPGCQRRLRDERAMAVLRSELEIRELTPADETDRYVWYRGTIDKARIMGKKLGWVFYRYQERWGEKPPTWMPAKAGIYEALFGRPAPRLLIEIAKTKGNQVEVMA